MTQATSVIKKTIEISREPAYLSVKLNQLQIRRGEETVGSFPCEDIGVLVVDHPQTTYSHGALASLAESDAALVVCGRDHLPIAVLLPLADHSQVVWRLYDQLQASQPIRKQIWKQLVQAKIIAQAAMLDPDAPARSKLIDLARSVRSGDPNNVEAQAARVYWANWLPDEIFRRDQDGDGLNSLLNYGYAILRAALARAIVAAGMHPALGLKHKNRSNAFCLADDLIEPLRPLVDNQARELYRQGVCQIDQEAKVALLQLLAQEVDSNGKRGPLMVALHQYVASLGRCLRGESRKIEVPRAC